MFIHCASWKVRYYLLWENKVGRIYLYLTYIINQKKCLITATVSKTLSYCKMITKLPSTSIVTFFCFMDMYIYMQCYHLHYACRALHCTSEFSSYHRARCTVRCIVRCIVRCNVKHRTLIYIFAQTHKTEQSTSGNQDQGYGNRHWSNPEVSRAGYKGHLHSIYYQLILEQNQPCKTQIGVCFDFS